MKMKNSMKRNARSKQLFALAAVALLLAPMYGSFISAGMPKSLSIYYIEFDISNARTALAFSSSSVLRIISHSGLIFDNGTFSFLASYLTNWYGVVILLVLLVMLVSAAVYILSGLINSQNGRQWARTQMYEALLGLVLIAIFLAFYSVMLTNPLPSFGATGLVPSTCNQTSVNTIFTLSSCDLSTFLTISNGFFQLLWYTGFIGGITPGFNLNVDIPFYAIGLSASTSIDSLFPASSEDLLSFGFDMLIVMLMLNQIQMILISGAPLFLALFMSIGLISWVLGFSRRFGGAMIAFGIGLGMVYPLLVAITYGFISTSILNIFGTLYSMAITTGGTASFTSVLTLALQVLKTLPVLIETIFSLIFTGSLPSAAGAVLMEYGYIFAGLTFIPFLNFMILDAFIIDFSKVMGERVSFMELINSLV